MSFHEVDWHVRVEPDRLSGSKLCQSPEWRPMESIDSKKTHSGGSNSAARRGPPCPDANGNSKTFQSGLRTGRTEEPRHGFQIRDESVVFPTPGFLVNRGELTMDGQWPRLWMGDLKSPQFRAVP